MSCVIAISWETQLSVELVNLSLTGMSFMSREFLNPGSIIYLTLTNSHCLFTTTKAAKIRYSSSQVGTPVTGCRFSEPLTKEELLILLA
jgi:hypothetical protein